MSRQYTGQPGAAGDNFVAFMRENYTTLNPGTLTTPESLQLSPRALPQSQAGDEQQEEYP